MADTEKIKGLAPLEQELDGSKLKVAIVHARWNQVIISSLIEGCKKSLKKAKVPEQNIQLFSVPGSFELPYCAQQLQHSLFFTFYFNF